MRLGNCAALMVLVSLTSELGLVPASAETKLTDFKGTWHGGGTDRYSPLEATQRTICQAIISADLQRMNAKIVCNGEAGPTKTVQLTIALAGDTFSGTLTQRAMTRCANSS